MPVQRKACPLLRASRVARIAQKIEGSDGGSNIRCGDQPSTEDLCASTGYSSSKWDLNEAAKWLLHRLHVVAVVAPQAA